MDKEVLAARIAQACGELGLSSAIAKTIHARAVHADVSGAGDEAARLHHENLRLRTQLEESANERKHMAAVQQQVMDLLGTTSPTRIIHDLRNVLNQLVLLQALCETEP